MALLLLVAALAALYAGSRWTDAAHWLVMPALLVCAVAGLTLPDIDQPLPLDHRSMVTHSIGPALAVLIRRWARPAAAGLALGLGLHLAADVFPEAMIGFATVKVPFGGSLGANLSYVWLGANALGCTWLGARLLRVEMPGAQAQLLAFLAVTVIGLAYLLSVDGGWPALAIYALAAWLLLRRPREGPVSRWAAW